MRSEESGTGAVLLPLDDGRARTEHRDTAVRERISEAGLGDQKGGARISLQVLGVFGESADKENRVTALKGDGHERTVGVARRIDG